MAENNPGGTDEGFVPVSNRRGNRGGRANHSGENSGIQQGPARGNRGGNRGNYRGSDRESGDYRNQDSGYGRGYDRGGDRGRGGRGGRGDHGGRANYSSQGRGNYQGGGSRDDYRSESGNFSGFPNNRGGPPRGNNRSQQYSTTSSQGRGKEREVDVRRLYNRENVPKPDESVSKIEDDIQDQLSHMGKAELIKVTGSSKIPHRPSYGTEGDKVTLWANYVNMLPNLERVLYRYSIKIEPSVEGKKREWVIKLWLKMAEMVKFKDNLVTDFGAILISCKEFRASEYEFAYHAEHEGEPSDNAKRYKVIIEPTKPSALTVADLINFLTSTNLDVKSSEDFSIIQALNIVARHYVKSSQDFVTIGRSKTYPIKSGSKQDKSLGWGLIALRGFFSSVRVATCRILVNVNITHGAFYYDGPLTKLISLYLRNHIPQDNSTGQGNFNMRDKFTAQRNLNTLHSFLNKVRVRVKHLKGKTKTISGLATENDGRGSVHPPKGNNLGAPPQQVQFWLEKGPASSDQKGGRVSDTKNGKQKGSPWGIPKPAAGRYISVANYFLETYGSGFNYGKSINPVVNLGTVQNPSYFPAEVCEVLPGQAFKSLLAPDQTRAMMDFAARRPKENAESISEGLRAIGLVSPTDKVLENFDINVAPNLITVPGRILKPPQITYRKADLKVTMGSWNMINVQFNVVGTLKPWTVLTINWKGREPRSSADVDDAVNKFYEFLPSVGMENAPRPQKAEISINREDDPLIEQRIRQLSQSATYLVVVLPSKDTGLYNHIKTVADIKVGIHTSCVVRSKFCKINNSQYYANVALKLNSKIGGTNQLVGLQKEGIISEDKTMIVGIDVTHPSPGSRLTAPSVAAVVASTDRNLAQWPAAVCIQGARQEMVDELESMLQSRLRLWMRGHRQSLPENILVYRDGVSEGQYAQVLDRELPLMRGACKNLYPPSQTEKGLPRITIVIVIKRHHTRFYPTDKASADYYENPKAGTVVDRGVTEARNWDFFLQAHTALLGTARPAHYLVVLDEIFRERYGLKATTELEGLTHKLCYTYSRTTKAISKAVPAYIADNVCDRARRYLKEMSDPANDSEAAQGARMDEVNVHVNLRDSMFYI